MQDGKITARGTPRSQQDRGKIAVRLERIVFTLVVVDNPAMKRILLITAALLCSLAGCATPSAVPLTETILDARTDTVGAAVRYPAGTARIRSYILTMVPGQETGWHRHDVPLYARVLGGELEVDYGGGTVKRYRAGDTFLEAMDRYHNGRVVGGDAVQILVVFMGAEGVSDTEMRK